jgi:UDP-glucose 4-epimerase
MSRALVTGGAGFIGSHLASSLLADGWEVDVVDDLSTGSAANVPDGAELIELDLAGSGVGERLPDREYDAICHLAGQASGEKSFDDPAADLAANAGSTVALAAWALERGIPTLVHASSMGVYGDPASLPVAETAPARPKSWYGASKRAAERSLDVATDQGLRTVSMRMFSIYGPGQDLADLRQGMVSIFLSMALRGDPIVVRGSLDRVRDFVYIDDCVAAWRAALERPEASGPVNVGTGVGTTVGELVDGLLAALGKQGGHPVEADAGSTPGDQFATVADPERAREILGWTPRWALRDGLEAMVAWAAT